MARRQPSAAEEWLVYFAARAGAAAISSLPVETALELAGPLGRLLYRWDRKHRERTLSHLKLAFPEWSQQRVEQVAIESFEHFVRLAVEVVHLPRLVHARCWPSRIGRCELGPAVELLSRGRPLLLVTGHYGNWEMLGSLLAVLGFPMAALARPIDHRRVNDWLLGIRESKGLRIITKWDATDVMVDLLRSGGALGFIADQNAGDRGMFVPYFGRLASSYKSIGLLAMQLQAPIIVGYARRIGTQARYDLGVTDIIRPEDWSGARDPLYYITARYNRALEMMIRECPQQYLWMHRRWKSRPRFEREARPAPQAVRQNLADLPWLAPPEVEALLRVASSDAGS